MSTVVGGNFDITDEIKKRNKILACLFRALLPEPNNRQGSGKKVIVTVLWVGSFVIIREDKVDNLVISLILSHKAVNSVTVENSLHRYQNRDNMLFRVSPKPDQITHDGIDGVISCTTLSIICLSVLVTTVMLYNIGGTSSTYRT